MPSFARRFWLVGHFLPIGARQAELSEDLFIRNRFVSFQPLVSFGDGLAVGVAQFIRLDAGFEEVHEAAS